MVDIPSDLPRLRAREVESHKGDYGRVVLIGGSRGMAGAISLSGIAALRSGAGLVTVAAPIGVLPTVASYSPCYMTIPLAEDEQGRIDEDLSAASASWLTNADVIACGPGLGRSANLDALVRYLYTEVGKPLVLDADALNALAGEGVPPRAAGASRILTPHPREFARLVGQRHKNRADAIEAATAAASDWNAVIVLKGNRTFITDGNRSSENTTGNPGMATGGSGDVLTGIVAALLGQGMAPFEAARLAAFVHGIAGDLAATTLGQVSLIATDIIAQLPNAFQELTKPDPYATRATLQQKNG